MVRLLLDRPCAPDDAQVTPLEYTVSCVNHRHRATQALHEDLQALTLLGDFRGHPVFLAPGEAFEAASLAYRDASGKQLGAIALTEGLVRQLAGEHQNTALRFVLAHEVGHLRHGHKAPRLTDFSGHLQLARNEEEADFAAFQDVESYAGIEGAASAIELVFSRFDANASDVLPAGVRAVTAARLHQLRGWVATAMELQHQARAEAARPREHLAQQ